AVVSKGGIFAEEHHAQDRLMFAGGNLVALAQDGDAVFAIGRIAHGMFMRPKMNRGPKLQARKFVARLQLVADMNGVLAVQEQEALFNHDAIYFEAPGGQAVVQSELSEVMAADQRIFRPAWLFAADLDCAASRQADVLSKVIEHDNPAERSRQRRDQQPVVTPGHAAGNRA